jgi:hypothetical protein
MQVSIQEQLIQGLEQQYSVWSQRFKDVFQDPWQAWLNAIKSLEVCGNLT